LSAPPDPIAAMRGPTSKGKGGEIEEGRGRGKGAEGEKGEEGTRRRNGPSHFLGQVYAPGRRGGLLALTV